MLELLRLITNSPPIFWTTLFVLVHAATTLTIFVRVVMSNRSVGATLSWIAVLFLFPLLGPGLYLLIGELRLGSRRAKQVSKLREPSRRRYEVLDRKDLRVDWHVAGEEYEMLAKAGQRLLQVPPVQGNQLELIDDWNIVFDRLIADIDSATINCDMEFYIWHSGGRSQEVVAALERAAQRGVICRILVDALGSRPFLRSPDVKRLKKAGVLLQAALPGGLWRLPFVRFDLRLHRKIVLIDDQVAWTGSLNMVDPRFFKQQAGVGQWVDAMARVQGPAVEALAITFQADWYVESNSLADHLPDVTGDQVIRKMGSASIQVLPSGPANQVEAIERILIAALYSARREVIITTPYFVPSEALQMALTSASLRGVKVIVVVPQKVDSLLVRWASQAFMDELMQAGVFIARFYGGLLHTKSVTIDSQMSLFGSLNMDPRSFRLNFEITLSVFDETFTKDLRRLQQEYLNQSHVIDVVEWSKRSPITRFGEKLARLMGPLL